MKKTKLILLPLILLVCLFSNCKNQSDKGARIDVEEKNGVRTKTFYNAEGNIEAMIVTENDSSIVAVPLNATSSNARKMSDEEYKCLKKCKQPDGSYDTNCTLLCPVTKQYKIFF